MQADTTLAVLDTAAVQTAQTVQPLERVMLAEDKLPVVLAVVLVVWIGIVFLLWRTERRLAAVERELDRLDS
ncbi:MAG: CcmD family protein [Bacteroidota bacterium]